MAYELLAARYFCWYVTDGQMDKTARNDFEIRRLFKYFSPYIKDWFGSCRLTMILKLIYALKCIHMQGVFYSF